MSKAIFIFPGQGAQYVGMGKDLYDNNVKAKEIFDAANAILDIDLKGLCFDGPKEELSRTDISQPAIFTASMAAFFALRKERSDINQIASLGLSLGEYTALAAAGSFSFEDGLRLVRNRGLFMQEASIQNPGKMIAVLNTDLSVCEEVCQASDSEIANLNSPGQVIIAGKNTSVDKAIELLKERGSKRIIPLDVSGAFHTQCMLPAQSKLASEIEKTTILDPTCPVISNVTADYENTASEIRDNLTTQVTSRTFWQKSIEKIISDTGCHTFYEIGPGKALKGFMKKISAESEVINIDTFQDLTQLTTS